MSDQLRLMIAVGLVVVALYLPKMEGLNISFSPSRIAEVITLLFEG